MHEIVNRRNQRNFYKNRLAYHRHSMSSRCHSSIFIARQPFYVSVSASSISQMTLIYLLPRNEVRKSLNFCLSSVSVRDPFSWEPSQRNNKFLKALWTKQLKIIMLRSNWNFSLFEYLLKKRDKDYTWRPQPLSRCFRTRHVQLGFEKNLNEKECEKVDKINRTTFT